MSVNAYFVKEVIFDDVPVFNINWNMGFMECFLEYCMDGTNDDFNGFIELDYDSFCEFRNKFGGAFPDEVESIGNLFRVNNLWSVCFVCF